MAEAAVSFLMDEWLEGIDQSKEEFFGNLLGAIDEAFYPQILVGTPYDGTERAKGKSNAEHIKYLWEHEVDRDGMAVTFGNPAPYGTVLDLGHYPGVGPRTVEGADGIYSQQAPEGIIRPLLKEKVLEGIIEQVKETFKGKLGSGE